MKKLKKFIIPIILIIVIILVVIIVKNNSNTDKQLLTELYNELSQKTVYQFTKQDDNDNKTVIVRNGTETAIDAYTSSSHTTTIIKDGKTTYVLHDREEYYIYSQANVEESIVADWIKDVIGAEEYQTGEEKIRGKRLYYEEYSGSTMFAETTALDVDESEIKTRFYFNSDNELVYIKTIYSEDEEELLKIEISDEIDSSIFEVPSTYAEN